MKDLNLYLIRHGQTEWNLKDKMQGSQNSPLTDIGISGAKITGKALQDIPFLVAYSSPQQRAVETRDYIIAENHHSIPVKTLDDLREMHFGLWEGQHVPELMQVPEFCCYLNEPGNYTAEVSNGEKYLEVLDRMKRGLDYIVKNTPQDKGNILIVSHGTALRMLLCVLSGGDWRKHRDEAYFPRILNTSVSLVNYQGNDDEGKYTVKYINNVDHIA